LFVKVSVMASSLDHIEKTLAEAYRKEIDQEENIWRSLPFFAATLALELGAIYQIAGHLPPAGTGAWRGSIGFIFSAGAATLTAIGFLAAAIFPAKFGYISPEPELLDYSERLDQYERERDATEETPAIDALAELKKTLAHECALAADYNRRINQRRAVWRSIAGVATLAGVLSIVALVATATAYYVWNG
jgi:hypothetical protein